MCSFFLLFVFFFCSSFSSVLLFFFFFSSSVLLLLFRLAFLRSGLFPGLLFYCAHWGLIKKSASRCQERPVSNTPARPLAFWPWNGNRADLEIWIGKKDVRLLCLRCWLVNLGSSFFCLFEVGFSYFEGSERASTYNLSVKCPFNLFYVLFVFRFVSFFRLFFRFVFTFYVSVFVLFFVFFRFFSFFFLFFLLVCLPGTYFMHSPRLARPAPCMNTNLLLISVFGHEMRHETGMNSNRYRFKMDETKTKEIRHDGNCDGSC